MSYLKQIAVCDASDDDIESWITVRGNHIPIMKGQSKGDAVKSFFEKRGGKATSEHTSKPKNEKKLKSLWEKKERAATNVESAKEQGGNVSRAKEKLYKAEKAFNKAKEQEKPDGKASEMGVRREVKKDLDKRVAEHTGRWWVKSDVTWNELRKGLNEGKTIGNMLGNYDDDVVYWVAGELAKRTGEEHHDLYDLTEENRRKYGQSGEYIKRKDDEKKSEELFASKHLKRAMNSVGKEKWEKMPYMEKAEAIKKEKDYYRTEGRNLYFDTNNGYGIRTDDPDFEKQFFEEYTDADKEDFKDYVKGFNSVGMTNEENQPMSIEETEKAIENFFTGLTERNNANGVAREYHYLKKRVSDLEKSVKENKNKQDEGKLKKELQEAKQELEEYVRYEMG